jgi:hypothetical protein
MEHLESINYNDGVTPTCNLDELTQSDIQDVNNHVNNFDNLEAQYAAFVEIIILKYGTKTFCIQKDYDYMFGNVSWEAWYLHYADAENSIKKDWEARAGTPHYAIDKSYITIYQFATLKKLEDEVEKKRVISKLWDKIITKKT